MVQDVRVMEILYKYMTIDIDLVVNGFTKIIQGIRFKCKIFSRDSDLSTSVRDEEMLKKMRRCLNISTSLFNISTSCVIKTNISTSFLNISTSSETRVIKTLKDT